MTMVNKDSQSAIEQKKEKAHYTHFYCGCVPSFYFSIFEFSDWFFKNTI